MVLEKKQREEAKKNNFFFSAATDIFKTNTPMNKYEENDFVSQLHQIKFEPVDRITIHK